MNRILRITAKRDGYRRCGAAHPGDATDHPFDRFTPDQVEALKLDSMLVVQEFDLGADGKPIGAAEAAAGVEVKIAEIDRLREEAAADREKAAEELKSAQEIRRQAEADAAAAKKDEPESAPGGGGEAGKTGQVDAGAGGHAGGKPKAKPKGKGAD